MIAKTWTRPWTIRLPLKLDNNYAMAEYACHEGNYSMFNILSGARADDKAAAEAAARGETPARRPPVADAVVEVAVVRAARRAGPGGAGAPGTAPQWPTWPRTERPESRGQGSECRG